MLGLLSALLLAAAFLVGFVLASVFALNGFLAVLSGEAGIDGDVVNAFRWFLAAVAAAGVLAAGSMWLAVVADGVRARWRAVCAVPGTLVLALLAYLMVSGLAG